MEGLYRALTGSGELTRSQLMLGAGIVFVWMIVMDLPQAVDWYKNFFFPPPTIQCVPISTSFPLTQNN